MANNIKPVAGKIYSGKEIVELSLYDEPFLMLPYRKSFSSVQMEGTELLTSAPLKDSQWRFARHTDELCPLFYFVGGVEERDALFDNEEMKDDPDSPYRWVTVKGNYVPQSV